MSGRKLSSWTQSSFFFLFLPHKVIFWVCIDKKNFIHFSMLRLLWIVFNVAWKWIMFKNRSLGFWGFEFWYWGFWLVNEKFLFVKSFDVVYVLKLIENGLGLCLGWFGGHKRQFTEFQNSIEFAFND